MWQILYDLKYGISNLIYWFKIIWKDRSWDWSFLIIILRHKLVKIEEQFGSTNNRYSCKTANRVHYAKLLCDRIVQDYYLMMKTLKSENDWEHQDYMLKQDIYELTNLLYKYLWCWWD